VPNSQLASARAREIAEQLSRLPDCVKLVGQDGRLMQMNPAGLAMLEVEDLADAQRDSLLHYIVPEHRPAFAALHRRVMAGEDGSLEFEVIGRRGTRRWLETRAVPMREEGGAVTALLGITRDVTRQRAQLARIERLNRTRGVMSSINALIVRTRSRSELFQEACRIVVEQGGFSLAWIGTVRGDRELVPVAQHGDQDGLLEGLPAVLAGDPAGAHAPTLRALREGPQVCNDIASEQLLAPWRERLLTLGYNSFVAYPLAHRDRVLGTLNLYAREPESFDEEEMRLLAELARDIAYALEFIIKDETLDHLSIYDPLTRLPNRTLLLSRLQEYVKVARDSGRRLALLMLDVERFKAINDAVGQAGGDELLKVIAERLKFHAGGPENVARVAGDRFAAVIRGLDPAVDVDDLVQQGAWDGLDPPFQHGGQDFPVTLKVGVAVFPTDGADAEELLRNAELALKDGKALGRRHTRYTHEMSKVAQQKLQVDRELRRALERDELVLHYQPKLDLRTGQVCGAEALLRWQSPDRGLVMPGSIIPLMEETGLIREVGQWALARAVSQREHWRREGLAPPRIGVNVSAVQLREGFVESVAALLADAPGAGAGLEIEVTESMIMADPDASIAMLRTLREFGLTVSMDDFGTGYSSLGYLTRLPLNAVKIDRSFIAAMNGAADTTSVVSSIIALAHSLHLRVVAEGVETDKQLRDLRLLRCDEMQGYLFSKPLPPDEFAALLKSGRTL
jgi:diguanylate cyclase (GGDEF)-like protein/PAS domain S-box-containing protein